MTITEEDIPDEETKTEEDQGNEDKSKIDEDNPKTMTEEMEDVYDRKFSSVYFKTIINDQKYELWGIKSSTQFTML